MTDDRLKKAYGQFRRNVREIHKANGIDIPLGSDLRYRPTNDDAVFIGVDATPEELIQYLDLRDSRSMSKIAVLQKYALAGLATEMTMHETNSLVGHMKSYGRHFREKYPDDSYGISLEQDAGRLYENFNFLSRFKASGSSYGTATAATILESIRHEFGRPIAHKDLVVEVTDAFMKAEIGIDRRVMHAVMNNLVRNSYYWATNEPGSKAVVRLDAERIEHDVDVWDDETETVSVGRGFSDILVIEDNGPGLPEEGRDELFEPGVSGRRSSGVGLAICRTGLESYGHTIVAADERSDLGGAKFRVGSRKFLRPDVSISDTEGLPRELWLAQAVESMTDLVRQEDLVEAMRLTEVYEEAAGLAMRIRLQGNPTPLEERLVRAVDGFHWELGQSNGLNPSPIVLE